VAAHFLERLQRLERLRLEALSPKVPEHRRVGRTVVSSFVYPIERGVENRLAVSLDERNGIWVIELAAAAEAGAVDPDGDVTILRVAELRVMAGGARHIPWTRQNRIPEQQPSKGNLCRRA
jgi:hypothetical protein